MPDEKSLIMSAAGGLKKGRIYGMGSEASRLKLQYHQSEVPSSKSSVDLEKLRGELEQTLQQQLQRELDKKDKEIEKERKKMRRTLEKKDRKMSALIDMNRTVMQHLNLQMPSIPSDSDVSDEDDSYSGPSAAGDS